MADIATLGMQIDSGPAATAGQTLDRFTQSAVKAQQANEGLLATAASASMAFRDQAASLVQETQRTLASIQAKSALQSAIQQTATSAQRAGAARGQQVQLDEYALKLQADIVNQTKALTQAQDTYTASISRYAAARQQTNAIQDVSADQFQQGINANMGVQGGSSSGQTYAQREQDIAAYGQSLDALRTKFNPVYAASKQYESALDQISAAQKVGAISATEADAAYEAERLTFEAASTTTDKLSSSHGGLSFQSLEAFRSVHNLVLSIAGGVSPTQAMTRAVSELSFASSGPGGLSGAFAGVGQMLGKFVNGYTIAAAAIIAAIAAVAVAEYNQVANEKALEAALLGPGRAAGITASQLNDLAVAASDQSKSSITDARTYAEQYAASGKLTATQIEQLTALTKDYATVTGQEADAAAKSLTSSFSDLSTGVDTLAKATGNYSAADRQQILDLQASGHWADANSLAISKLASIQGKYNDQLTEFGRLGNSVKGLWNTLFNPPPETTGTQLQSLVSDLQSRAQGNHDPQVDEGNASVYQSTETEAQKAYALLMKLTAEMAKAGKDAHDQFLNNLSLRTDDISKALAPAFSQINTMLNNRNALAGAQAAGFPGMNPTQIAAATRALATQSATLSGLASTTGDVTVQGQKFLSQQQIQEQQDALAIKSIYAKTAAQKSQIAQEQERLALLNSEATPAEREALIQAAGKQAYDQTTKSITDQNQALTLAAQGSLAAAKANLQGNIPALLSAQAHTQALTQAITEGISVQQRQAQIYAEAVAEKVSSAAGDAFSTRAQEEAQLSANQAVLSGKLAYDQLSDAVTNKVRDAQLEQLRTAAVATGNKSLVSTIDSVIDGYKELDQIKNQNVGTGAAAGLLNPYASDITALKALNEQLKAATINEQQYLAARSKVGLESDINSTKTALAASNPFGATGKMGADTAIIQAKEEEATRLKQLQDAEDAGIIASAQEAAAMRVAIEQDAAAKIQAAYANMYIAQVDMGTKAFGDLATAVGGFAGKSSAAYRVLFGIQKAFDIASAEMALQVAITQAMAIPFPDNIPAIATAISLGARIISDITSIVMPSGASGHAMGVVGISGAGSSMSDSIPAWLSQDESVVNASGTRRNRQTLTAINNGAAFDQMLGKSNASRAPMVQIIHDGSTMVVEEKVSDERIAFVAKRIVQREAPRVVAQSQDDAYGEVARAMRRTLDAKRKLP